MKNVIILIVIVFIIFIVFVLCRNFYIYQNLSKLSSGIVAPSSTTQTVDWKTYTNEQYGFSFQYPKTMVVSSIPYSSIQPVLVLETKSTPDPVVDGTQKYNYSLVVDVVEDQNKIHNNAKSFTSFIIDGIDAQISDVYKVGDEGGKAQSVVFRKDGKWYHIDFGSGALSPSGTFESNRPIFDHILSTFKFTK